MNTERLERDNPIIKALHKVKPAKVLVTERGKEQPRAIALSKGRNRWRALLDTLDALAWTSIEARDEQDATLCIITPEDDDESTALVPSGGADGGPPDRVDDVRDIVLIMRDVQRETLREARDIFAAQADATSRMLDSVTDAMRTMREAYEMALRLATANAATGGSDSDGITNLMQMAAMMNGMGGGGRVVPMQPRPAPSPPPPKQGAKP